MMINLLKKMSDLVDVLGQRGGAASLWAWRPRSLASFRLVSALRREQLDFQTIIDGGANIGQFARAASWAFPQAHIYSFEPLPDVAERYRHNLSDLPNVAVTCAALGDQNTTVEFHRHAYSQSSSILHVNEQAPDAAVAETITVPMMQLDTWLGDRHLPRPVLLKLDLQGYELPALQGAERLLAQTDHLLIESVFTEAYRGESLFEDIWRYLDNCGFRFVKPLAAVQAPGQGIVQIDALFSRRGQGGRPSLSN